VTWHDASHDFTAELTSAQTAQLKAAFSIATTAGNTNTGSVGWTWALAYHLLNGIRHLVQDLGYGYKPEQFVRNGWIVTIGSFVLTALVWACVFAQRGGA